MTNEELAKHWNTSVEEVKRISDFMNTHFYLGIARHRETGLFHGVMYTLHESPSGNKTPLLVLSSNQGFATRIEAIQNWNNSKDSWQMPKMKAQLLGVPVDAYKALDKIEAPTVVAHKDKSISPTSERGPRE